jgi:thiamine-monophosphate kinase
MVQRDTPLAEGRGEFELIRQMRERWGSLAVGIGDDAAVLQPPRGEQLVISTDAAVDGVHFRRDWLEYGDIGYRAVTAGLSDLAAMAAAPRGVLISLIVPAHSQGHLMQLADGIGDAVRAATTVVVGGNLSLGETLSITMTVVGSAYSPLTRSGARSGDLLYVTGQLGGARAAWRLLESGRKPDPALFERFARPVARISESRWLAARGAIAAIDVSDGLGGDAAQLAAASESALEIEVERVPVHPGAHVDDALIGGEDYEILVAARAPLPQDEFARQFRIPLTPIGRFVERGHDVRFVRNGQRVAAPAGHDHFSR